jgi:hypothetical protein
MKRGLGVAQPASQKAAPRTQENKAILIMPVLAEILVNKGLIPLRPRAALHFRVLPDIYIPNPEYVQVWS